MKCGDTHHRQGFSYPANHFQCKNCNRIGHFTSKCLTKSKAINQINFQEEINSLNAWQAQEDADTFYIFQVQEQQQAHCKNTQRVSKHLYVNLPLTARYHHKKWTYLRARIDPGADVNTMPGVSVQVPNWRQKTSASGTCPMHYDSCIQTTQYKTLAVP